MTNGEKLKEVFPNTIFIKEMSPEGKMIGLVCSDGWWNEEYNENFSKAFPNPELRELYEKKFIPIGNENLRRRREQNADNR